MTSVVTYKQTGNSGVISLIVSGQTENLGTTSMHLDRQKTGKTHLNRLEMISLIVSGNFVVTSRQAEDWEMIFASIKSIRAVCCPNTQYGQSYNRKINMREFSVLIFGMIAGNRLSSGTRASTELISGTRVGTVLWSGAGACTGLKSRVGQITRLRPRAGAIHLCTVYSD